MVENGYPGLRDSVEALKALGQKLGQLRDKAGLTQAQLAHDAQMVQSTLSRFERGEMKPAYSQVRNIIQVLERYDIAEAAEELLSAAHLAGVELPHISRNIAVIAYLTGLKEHYDKYHQPCDMLPAQMVHAADWYGKITIKRAYVCATDDEALRRQFQNEGFQLWLLAGGEGGREGSIQEPEWSKWVDIAVDVRQIAIDDDVDTFFLAGFHDAFAPLRRRLRKVSTKGGQPPRVMLLALPQAAHDNDFSPVLVEAGADVQWLRKYEESRERDAKDVEDIEEILREMLDENDAPRLGYWTVSYLVKHLVEAAGRFKNQPPANVTRILLGFIGKDKPLYQEMVTIDGALKQILRVDFGHRDVTKIRDKIADEPSSSQAPSPAAPL